MGKIKIVLREAVHGVGDAGDVATVAGGYARNYLIPRKLAVTATPGNLKQAESWKKSKSTKASKEAVAAQELKVRMEAAQLQVSAQAGPDGRLFGSVTPAQIAAAISEAIGAPVDRHDVLVGEPIRHLGFHEATVRLHPEVAATVTVEVVEA